MNSVGTWWIALRDSSRHESKASVLAVLHAIDILLAELHRVCIYAIPMHLVYRKSIFQSEEAHFKSIGYREDGENLEYKSFFFKLKYRRLFKPARIIYKVVWCTGAGLSMS
ncbi:protein GLE1 [Trifolium repens]|nr:protein GLE1 [Trifolium repens]